MAGRVRRPAAETRSLVLDVAGDLFYWRGIRATGVDTVASAAGIAPTTLYRLFASKDDLVRDYVERAAERYRERWERALDAAGPDPKARILALFDLLVDEVDPAGCRGCLFQLAAAEVADEAQPAHRRAAALKAWTRTTLVDLAVAAGGPADLGEELWLLVEGVYGAVQTERSTTPAHRARALAETLVEVRTGGSGR